MAERSIYTTGGTVQAGGGIYLERQADQELFNLCRQGTFAYVLTPRQMGKSSLMVQTAARLSQEETRSVIIDLTALGVGVTAEQWYLGLLTIIEEQLDLETDAVQWWQERTHLGFTQRMTQFFKEVLLVEVAERVLIFVDEIDSTLSLDFTDDFFAAIRYLYVARAQEPDFHRLSFVLIGVATPGDLIRDPKRTPFNVGQRVDLTDFTVAEAMPLTTGLGLPESQREAVMGWVLKWTGGHPYLSQRLCGALLESRAVSGSRPYTEADVDQVVNQTFFGGKSEQDNNLQFVRDMLTKRAPAAVGADAVLKTYREVRRGRLPVLDEEQSLVKSHLKLSGVVRRQDKCLVVRNRIYGEVFNPAWIQEHLPENWWQRYKPVLKWAVPLMAASVIVAVVMAGLAQEAQRQRVIAEQNAVEAQRQKEIADRNAKTAQERTIEAQRQKASAIQSAQKAQKALLSEQEANRQRQIALNTAEAQRKRAQEQTQIALEQRRLAEEQTAVAQTRTRLAVKQTQIARTQTRIAEEQTTIAQLREQAAQVLNWISTASAAEGLVLAIDTMDRSQLIANIKSLKDTKDVKKDVTISAQSSLLAAVQRSQEANRLQGHTAWVSSVAFSPDGQRLVSGGGDKTVRLWDARTGQPIGQPLQGHGANVRWVAFSPDSRRLVSGSEDKTVRLWDARTGQPIGLPLQGHTALVSSVAFSPDGQRLVSGSEDKTVRLWDARTGQPIGLPLQGHTALVSSVAFSPDGQRLVSGSGDETVRLWDARTGQPIGLPLQGHTALVSSVAFSPDGQRLVSGSYDKTVRLWDARTGQPIGQPLQGHTDSVSSVAFSPDGQRLVSGGGGGDKTVRLWDARIGQPIGQPLQGHTDVVYSVAFSPDGQRLVSGGGDKTVRLWDARTGQPIGLPLQGHTDSFPSVAFSPDGQRLVSGGGGRDKTVRLWDARTGQPIGLPLQGHTAWVSSVAFSPDGQRLVSGGGDKTVRLWDARTGQPIGQPLQGHTDSVSSVAFSLDGQRLVSGGGGGDNTVRLWDARIGQPIGQPLQGHTDSVSSVAFSPDGQRLVSGSYDKTVRLWDARTGQPIGLPLQGHTAWVSSVAFSPNGQRLVSSGYDKTVRLWDTSPEVWLTLACTRLQYHPLLNHPETVVSDPEFLPISHRVRAVCQQKVWHKAPVTTYQSPASQSPLVSKLHQVWVHLTWLFSGKTG